MDDNNDLLRLLILIGAFVLLFPILMMVFAWPMMGMWGGGHMWDSGLWEGSGATWVWVVMWVVLLLLILGGGYLLYRVGSRPESHPSDAALDALRVAYAKGELSDEEFENRRQRLQREE